MFSSFPLFSTKTMFAYKFICFAFLQYFQYFFLFLNGKNGLPFNSRPQCALYREKYKYVQTFENETKSGRFIVGGIILSFFYNQNVNMKKFKLIL